MDMLHHSTVPNLSEHKRQWLWYGNTMEIVDTTISMVIRIGTLDNAVRQSQNAVTA